MRTYRSEEKPIHMYKRTMDLHDLMSRLERIGTPAPPNIKAEPYTPKRKQTRSERAPIERLRYLKRRACRYYANLRWRNRALQSLDAYAEELLHTDCALPHDPEGEVVEVMRRQSMATWNASVRSLIRAAEFVAQLNRRHTVLERDIQSVIHVSRMCIRPMPTL